MRRPSITTPCVADHYHAHGERIAEVHGPQSQAGCLIGVREYLDDDGRWYLDVHVYRADGDVHSRVKIPGRKVA